MEQVKVLVVDDSSTARMLLAHFVGQLAMCDVTVAENGPAAIQLLTENRADLILLDINMPGMHGLDVLREIRDRWGEAVSVIIISGSRERHEVDQLKALQISGYLVKPVKHRDVVAVIGGQVDRIIAGRAAAV